MSTFLTIELIYLYLIVALSYFYFLVRKKPSTFWKYANKFTNHNKRNVFPV